MTRRELSERLGITLESMNNIAEGIETFPPALLKSICRVFAVCEDFFHPEIQAQHAAPVAGGAPGALLGGKDARPGSSFRARAYTKRITSKRTRM